jgi:hypothetical protein
MDLKDRAAQFAPYAALTGFGDVVSETARLTEERKFQDEGEIEKIDRTLTYILTSNGALSATFTYFENDKTKSGGHYEAKTGYALKFNEEKRTISFSDGSFLSIDDIVKIEFE